jgi:hypothetical protein
LYQKISRTRPSMTDTPPPIKTDIDFALRSVRVLKCLYRFRDSCCDDNPEKRLSFF